MNILREHDALVTRAFSGFGSGIALQLVKKRDMVYIAGRSAERLKALSNEIGAIPVVADVTRSEEGDHMFDFNREQEGRLDILVNNADSGDIIKPIMDQENEEIFQTFQTKLTSAIFGSKKASPTMKKQHAGIIISISSSISQSSS